MKKVLLKIEDDILYEAIKKIAKENNEDVTKTINEMLWLSLQPKWEQTKKVKALRANTLNQLNLNPSEKPKQDYAEEDIERILDLL